MNSTDKKINSILEKSNLSYIKMFGLYWITNGDPLLDKTIATLTRTRSELLLWLTSNLSESGIIDWHAFTNYKE